MKASLVEVGETVMAPPLMEIGWGQGEPAPNPSPTTWRISSSHCPKHTLLPSQGRKSGAAAEKGNSLY